MDENIDEMSMNLRSLKQMDGSIDQIVMSCGQCAVYKFSNTSNEWERKEIEGSMFVVHRQRPIGYGFVVINRLNTTNMFQSIDHNFDINITVPYLLYKNSLNEIFCIWFYDEKDCKNFSHELKHIIQRLAEENNQNRNDILKRLISMDINDDKTAQRHQSNGQTTQRPPTQPLTQPPTQTPTQTQTQPQKLSLQVHQLFQSHIESQTLTLGPMPALPSEAVVQTMDDSLLNDVITPSMLTQTLTKCKPNESVPQPPQPSAPMSVTTGFNNNFVSVMANKDRLGAIPTVPVLSMEQLKQTLIHLLQTDADFLHCIHSAYIQSIKK